MDTETNSMGREVLKKMSVKRTHTNKQVTNNEIGGLGKHNPHG